jgi:HK97 family phage prohead protease
VAPAAIVAPNAATGAFRLLREYKAFAEVKFTGDSHGGFEGYGSLFGVLDSGGDIVEKGAFAEDLGEFVKDGFISLGHNWEGLAIGTVKEAYEDSSGLYLRTEYHSTQLAQDARRVAQERLDRGKSVGLSIGYGVKPGGMKSGDDARHLTNLHLFEVAQVNVPMLRPAGLTGIKSLVLPFEEHSDNVRVAIDEWLERVRSGSDVRLKAGRAISEARRSRIAAVREALRSYADEIDALLSETEPRADEPIVEEAPVEKAVEIPPTDPALQALRDEFLTLYAMHKQI